MQNAVLFTAYMLLLVVASSQPIYLMVSLLRKLHRERKESPGAYRDSLEAALQASRGQKADLEARLAASERISAQKDRLIHHLWFRVHGDKLPRRWPATVRRTVRRLMVAGTAAFAMAGGVTAAILVTPLGRTDPEPDQPPIAQHLARAPERGIPIIPLHYGRDSGWQCRSRRPTMLAVGSTVIPLRCPLRVTLNPSHQNDGDRAWMLWIYPERTGPETLSYVLN